MSSIIIDEINSFLKKCKAKHPNMESRVIKSPMGEDYTIELREHPQALIEKYTLYLNRKGEIEGAVWI